jgi:predicted AAA+ superfamily ATPase
LAFLRESDMIKREIQKNLESKLFKSKAIILVGARQVGKTTLLQTMLSNREDLLWLNGDELEVQKMFENISAVRLSAILGSKKIVVIDEAQRIADIGLRLKLITDSIPEVQLIAAGSSSFELADKVNEPLTGRKWEYKMYPISFREMVNHEGLLYEKRMIPHRMVFGYYPDVVMNPGDEKEILKQLSDSYLYKDILMWKTIKNPDKILKLLQAIAFQIGYQVSNNELAQICGIDSKTVEKYIDLLEKTFIIFRLSSFNRNLRNELKSSKKIYFYDNGIRNAVIANYSQIENRQDIGQLWENFVISERIKFLHYSGSWANTWFWRTKEQKEIDLIEELDNKITAYEFKWNKKTKVKIPKLFLTTYKEAEIKIVHNENLEEILL